MEEREHLAPRPLRLIRAIIIAGQLAADDRASCERISLGNSRTET